VRVAADWRGVGIAILTSTLLLASLGLAEDRVSAYPTQVQLSARAPSGLLTIQNLGDEPLRFQLSLVAWEQTPTGEHRFAPTQDVVCFPPLLSLEPGEKRPIRIGATAAVGAVEKTYRVFIEQLPPLRSPEKSGAESQVRVLTRLGVPIFLAPVKPMAGRGIELADVAPGRISLVVKNKGNVHFQFRKVRLIALGTAGEQVFERELPGAYVLAGGSRVYPLEVDAANCPKVARLEVEVTTEKDSFGERLDFPPGVCAR